MGIEKTFKQALLQVLHSVGSCHVLSKKCCTQKIFYRFNAVEIKMCCYCAVESRCQQRRILASENLVLFFFVDVSSFTFLQVLELLTAVAELVVTFCGILSNYGTFEKTFSCAGLLVITIKE